MSACMSGTRGSSVVSSACHVLEMSVVRGAHPHHTLAALKRYFPVSLVAALPTSEQINHLKSYLHKVDAKSHPSPLCPLCNTHTHDTHHLFNYTHIRTTLSPLDLCTDPAGVTALLARWTEKLAGGPQAGTSDSPLATGMVVGRLQQRCRWNV